jgi:hypothetical protein
MSQQQYVCTVCGYNMIGYNPDNCPFCGARQTTFITAENCSKNYKIIETFVNSNISRLNTSPALGYEHAAYRIKTPHKTYMIDCPSCFDPTIEPLNHILFTHHHFMGAANLYRKEFNADVWLHNADTKSELCKRHTIDHKFTDNFRIDNLEAFHINGHTDGFTFYIFQSTLFLCDYLFIKGDSMQYNPFGPEKLTQEGGKKILSIIYQRNISTVCGYNYVIPFTEWKYKFDNHLKVE